MVGAIGRLWLKHDAATSSLGEEARKLSSGGTSVSWQAYLMLLVSIDDASLGCRGVASFLEELQLSGGWRQL